MAPDTNIRLIKQIFFVILLSFFSLAIFITSVSNTISKPRKGPNLESSRQDLAIRGDIISNDNFNIATSKKLFKASIDIRSLDKEELFVKLFSIYSNIDQIEIQKKIDDAKKRNKKNIVLSYKIDSRTAKNLKELSHKLIRYKVFRAIYVHGTKITYGLSIKESGEKRVYLYNDALTPVIGYMKKFETKTGRTKINGVKGLERFYNPMLNDTTDGLLKGQRDVLSYIIFNKKSTINTRKDGKTIQLNISLKLQRNIELMLDRYKKKLKASEIIVSIMDSVTGKILVLASSNRFNPNKIQQNDIQNLNISAIEYQFEPGSIIKPLSIALVLDQNRVNRTESIYIHNKGRKNSRGLYPKGKYKLGKWTIHDDHKFKSHYITLQDIIIHSSNIGTLLLAQRLSGKEFYDGLNKFGLSHKTGIDLPYEQKGLIHTLKQYKSSDKKRKYNIFKATDAYGQGITTTFMQMLKAYSVFNNDGKSITPQLRQTNINPTQIQVLNKKTANLMKYLLVQTVKKGTGRKAYINGLEIGGKTGTANMVENKKYQQKYVSSFFGFANDIQSKYTIGVTVIDPAFKKKNWKYYASDSAVPIFKELVQTMVLLNYLEPNFDIIQNFKK